MNDQKLRSKLIRLAHSNPELRSELLPLLAPNYKSASAEKVAVSEETEDFVEWCIMKNDKLSVNECKRILDHLKVPMIEAAEGKAPTRGPLEKGEMVRCDAAKNTNQLNTQVCEDHNGQIGSIIDVDGNALVVEFTDGVRNFGTGRFEGRESGSKTGLYRYTPSDAGGANTRAMVEVVYIKDQTKPPSKDRIEQVEKYVEKGTAQGEQRSRIYYTGNPLKQAIGKDGSYFFTVFSAQRDQFPTSINPTKGQVLYVGQLGRRPGGWKSEFAKMQAEAAAKGQ